MSIDDGSCGAFSLATTSWLPAGCGQQCCMHVHKNTIARTVRTVLLLLGHCCKTGALHCVIIITMTRT